MAKSAKFGKKAQESALGKLVDASIYGSAPTSIGQLGYATDFIESPQGLGIKLYPAQRLIVKLTFGIPLDYKPQMIPVWDSLKEKLRFTLSESDFLKFLYDEQRCNVNDWRDIPPRGFGTTVIYAGRRGGKSQVVSAIAGTCLRNLLSIPDPQTYYGVVPGSTIDFTMLGTDEMSSSRLYAKLQADVNRSPFFSPYIRDNGNEMTFVSQADKDRRDVKPSITVAAFPCTTNAVRGPSSYFLALDEFQHFKSGKNTNSDDLYKAATPSTSMFPSKDDPDIADSRILVISSPLGKIGKMYELHKRALDEGVSSDILTLRLSTVEMNPGIPRSKLLEDYKNNPESFPAEFGGQFMDGKGSYLPPEKFDICVEKERHNITRFNVSTVGRKYFWALDYGTKIDATALAIGHLEMRDRGVTMVYDYIDRMMVGEKFTGPGIIDGDSVATCSELRLEDTISWLVYMNQILPCFRGVTDQHGGTTLKQLLQINGITTMDLLHLNDQINSRMYLILKGFIGNASAFFPNVPKFTTEFKQLEAEYKSKYVLKVEAPKEKGAHDDMADAAAMVAYIAQDWLDKEGKLDLDPTGRALQVDPRIANSNTISYLDPNLVSIRDIQIRTRMNKLGDGLLLPPGFTTTKNPFHRR